MAQVYLPFLEKSVWAYVMRDCPTILSLGILCNDEGWNYSWQNGKDPVLWKDKVAIRLHSKQKVPMMYAAASTGNDHSIGPGSKSQPESVSSSNQDPPHSTQGSSSSPSSNSTYRPLPAASAQAERSMGNRRQRQTRVRLMKEAARVRRHYVQ